MKKVKIMLASLLVLSAVGGVLAFKAKEENYCLYRRDFGTLEETCPKVFMVETVKITINGPLLWYTRINDGACPAIVPITLCTFGIKDVTVDN